MPNARGYEPFSYIWVLQVNVGLTIPSFFFDCTTKTGTWRENRCRYFMDQIGYDFYKAHIPSGIRIVQDYGRQKWFNDKFWIQQQLMDEVINGNFIPNLQPT